jgi:hypothetical protein
MFLLNAGNENKTSTSRDLFALDKSGWELALVTAPSNHTNQQVDNQLVHIPLLSAEDMIKGIYTVLTES